MWQLGFSAVETLSSTASIWYPIAGSGERTLSRLWHNTCMHTHIHTTLPDTCTESKPQPGSSSTKRVYIYTVRWQLDPVRSLNRQWPSLSPSFYTHKHTLHTMSLSDKSPPRMLLLLKYNSITPQTRENTHANIYCQKTLARQCPKSLFELNFKKVTTQGNDTIHSSSNTKLNNSKMTNRKY